MLFEYGTEDYKYLNICFASCKRVKPLSSTIKKGTPLTVKHSPGTWFPYRKSGRVWGALFFYIILSNGHLLATFDPFTNGKTNHTDTTHSSQSAMLQSFARKGTVVTKSNTCIADAGTAVVPIMKTASLSEELGSK